MAAASFHVNLGEGVQQASQQQALHGGHHSGGQDHSASPGTPTSSKAAFAEGIDCFGNERLMLQEQEKYFNSQVLSDVVLKVGEKQFYAHKLLLIRASDVFERMFSTEWADPDKKDVELVEDTMCVEVFPYFLKFLYSCHAVLNVDNALPLLILADKYNVKNLQDVCIEFARTHIIPKLQLKDVFHVWFQYATKCYHQKLITSCISALSEKMDDITQSAEWEQEWIDLEKEQLLEFLKSSNLSIKDEFELWLAVLKWLQTSTHPDRMVKMETHLKSILPYVRFPMMTPDQLCEVEKSRLYEQYPLSFQPYLMQAYKYHSLSLGSRANQKEFTTCSFLLRNYTDLRWDKRLVVANYSSCQCTEILRRFHTRSSSFPAQTWEWEFKINPKGFQTTSDEFRCVLSSNLILDQHTRPVEFLLSVVDHEKILCTVTGKKNFSKNRYTADTEIDKKISVCDLTGDSPYLVNDSLTIQIILKPVE